MTGLGSDCISRSSPKVALNPSFLTDVEKTPEKREPARTEIAPTVVGGPSEEKPVVLEESASSTQKPVVSKENDAPQENAPSEIKERSPLEVKPERSPPGGTKPAPFGLKPFVLPRERATTSTALKAPSSQSRERAATADAPLSNPASKEPVRPHGPPKFGVGIGGAEGGGLLAEMKMRQERTASLGRVRKKKSLDKWNFDLGKNGRYKRVQLHFRAVLSVSFEALKLICH